MLKSHCCSSSSSSDDDSDDNCETNSVISAPVAPTIGPQGAIPAFEAPNTIHTISAPGAIPSLEAPNACSSSSSTSPDDDNNKASFGQV